MNLLVITLGVPRALVAAVADRAVARLEIAEEDEIELLQDWADAGAPEGTPDDTPVPDFIAGTSLDRVDLSITIGQPWRTEPSDDVESWPDSKGT